MRRDEEVSGQGIYPERAEVRPSFADRLIGNFGFQLHSAFARGPRDFSTLAQQVRGHADRFSAGLLAPLISELRYRLRRQGLTGVPVAEALALFAVASGQSGGRMVPAEVLGAAQTMLQGRVAELPDAAERRQAVAFAAAAFAVAGIPVHVITGSDALAQDCARELKEPMTALGLTVDGVVQGQDLEARRGSYRADVVCVTHRDLAADYLRDRMLSGGRPRQIQSALDRVAGEAPPQERLMLRGLQCAIVEDADMVLIDDARIPVAISRESDHSQERLLYEQAVELARALAPDADFVVDDGAAHLTAAGSGRLARLVQALGGVWGGQHRREELIREALNAMYCMERERDYQIVQGRVVFPQVDPEVDGDDAPGDLLLHLVEVKEGLRFAGKRDVLARISAPRFFSRYLHLCGTCADAAGLERELWSMYQLRAERSIAPAPVQPIGIRAFATAGQKRQALLESVSKGAGRPLLLAVRTPQTAKDLLDALAAAGLRPALLRGTDDDEDRAVLSNAQTPGAVTIAVHPADRSVNLGGGSDLRLVVVEMHDSARHLQRLRHAYGAQSTEMWLALDEEAVAAQLGLTGQVIASRYGGGSGELPPRLAVWLARRAQRRIERWHAGLRAEVMTMDRFVSDLLAFSGTRD